MKNKQTKSRCDLTRRPKNSCAWNVLPKPEIRLPGFNTYFFKMYFSGYFECSIPSPLWTIPGRDLHAWCAMTDDTLLLNDKTPPFQSKKWFPLTFIIIPPCEENTGTLHSYSPVQQINLNSSHFCFGLILWVWFAYLGFCEYAYFCITCSFLQPL